MQIAHVSFLGILITLVLLYLLITYISTCSPYFRYLGSISRYIFHLYLLSLSHHNLLSFSFSFWLQMAWCKSLRGHLLCANAKLVRFCEPNPNPNFACHCGYLSWNWCQNVLVSLIAQIWDRQNFLETKCIAKELYSCCSIQWSLNSRRQPLLIRQPISISVSDSCLPHFRFRLCQWTMQCAVSSHWGWLWFWI